MIDWLGIEHLVKLTAGEAVLGFLTPLFVFVAFFVLAMVLPAKRVPGYVVDSETGQPRSYRLNGLLVFVAAQVLWWFELTGMPRDWFYRSSLYAVAGGTVLAVVMTLIAVFSQPEGDVKSKSLACWFGRAQEMQFFNDRIDLKMYFYIVGGTMLSLNAFSGAAWHYDNFDDPNPGAYLFAAFFTFYVFDYFVFERVQLYTYDVIYERLGFKMFWGGADRLRLDVHHPDVGHGRACRPPARRRLAVSLADRDAGAVRRGLVHQPWCQHADIHVQAVARTHLRRHQARDHRGRRAQDPVQRLLGRIPASQLTGRGLLRTGPRLELGPPRQPVGVGLFRLCPRFVHLPPDGR